MGNDDLAILGGRPARDKRITARFISSEKTRRRVLALIDGQVLSDFYGGPYAHAFEEAFSAYHGSRHAIATNSGTAAMHTALLAEDVGPGDEVIVPTFCFFTAASTVLQQNATPVLCDCRPDSLGIDVEQMKGLITDRTRAIMVVHLNGYPADIKAVCAVAAAREIPVIEDAAQAHGATVDGRKVGTFGSYGCFSFGSPRKHIAVGEGGMVMTDDDARAVELRRITYKGKDNGWFTQKRLGHTYGLPEFEAILGLQGLGNLDAEIEARRAASRAYDVVLEGSGLDVDHAPANLTHVHFRKIVRLPRGMEDVRDFMVAAIKAENISASPLHAPVHRIAWIVDALRRRSPERNFTHFPVTDAEFSRIIDLESGPCLSEAEARRSAEGVLKVWTWIEANRDRVKGIQFDVANRR